MTNQRNVQGSVSAITAEESRAIDILRIFAILCVLAAHVFEYETVPLTSIRNVILYICKPIFAGLGVPCFFILGGFLYQRKPGDTKAFWIRKLWSLVIPWFCCSLITYGVRALMRNPVGALDYVKWIFGVGTWYYYFTVFTIYLMVFKVLTQKEICLYGSVLIQLLVNILPLFGITATTSFASFCMLIPANIGYFALGILIRRHRWDRALLKKRSVYGSVVIAVVSFMVMLQGKSTIIPWWDPYDGGHFLLVVQPIGKVPVGRKNGNGWNVFLLHLFAAYANCAAHLSPIPSHDSF